MISKNNTLFFAAMALTACLPAFVDVVHAAETITINYWIIPYKGPDEVDVEVGDTIRFRWNRDNHNVYIHPSGSCDMDGRKYIGADDGTSYTFKESDAGEEIFFACDIGNGAHCEVGQYLVAYVSDAATEPPTEQPVADDTEAPTEVPTDEPVGDPTEAPVEPTEDPTEAPDDPTEAPVEPTEAPVDPTEAPVEPTDDPTEAPDDPTEAPVEPTEEPTRRPTKAPTRNPTKAPQRFILPTDQPAVNPTPEPTRLPTNRPTHTPTHTPTHRPSHKPTFMLLATIAPLTKSPTVNPTSDPTRRPTGAPASQTTPRPTTRSISSITSNPTARMPTASPTISNAGSDLGLLDGDTLEAVEGSGANSLTGTVMSGAALAVIIVLTML